MKKNIGSVLALYPTPVTGAKEDKSELFDYEIGDTDVPITTH